MLLLLLPLLAQTANAVSLEVFHKAARGDRILAILSQIPVQHANVAIYFGKASAAAGQRAVQPPSCELHSAVQVLGPRKPDRSPSTGSH
jgi:hypothetical protein